MYTKILQLVILIVFMKSLNIFLINKIYCNKKISITELYQVCKSVN